MKKHALFFISCLIMLPQLTNGQLIDLNGRWKFAIGDQMNWSDKDYDDSDWEDMRVPAFWEDEGYHRYDGFAWYRTTFDGSKLKPTDKLFLKLGYIDDTDEVYLNGELIGFSGSMPPNYKTAYNTERNYVLPSYLIDFKGANTIAVRVFDSQQGGGIADGNIGIFRVSSGSPILLDLQGVWEFKISPRGSRPDKYDRWDKIIVPGFWEKQGYWKYNGYAWYRKSFNYTPEMEREELVLILGKIDDFDEVYLNGKMIGKTIDYKKFGWSTSYDQFRIYYLPQAILNKTEANTIEVRVEDIGIDGGIYEGPIGITTKDRLSEYIKR